MPAEPSPTNLPTPLQWQQLKQIIAATLEKNPNEWPALLLAQCGDDVDLFFEASSLLAGRNALGKLYETPVWRQLST